MKKIVNYNKISLIGIFILLSIIFALGFNNVTRELQNIDNGLIVFLTFSSISFILGTFLYTSRKEKSNNSQLIFRFILAGILIILAFSLSGLVGDVKAESRNFAFFSFDILSPTGLFLIHILSFVNVFGLVLFFYSLLELIYYLRAKDNKPLTDWNILWVLFVSSAIIYIILSGIIFPLNPPKLELYNLNSANETMLHISDKEWFITINLTEYFDVPVKDYYPSRFFIRYKDPIFVSAFAQKVPSKTNPNDCRDFYERTITKDNSKYENFTEEERNGGALSIYQLQNNPDSLFVDYYDIYDNYCFIFHTATYSKDKNISKTYELLDSINLFV